VSGGDVGDGGGAAGAHAPADRMITVKRTAVLKMRFIGYFLLKVYFAA
jgi:hypothetical protein